MFSEQGISGDRVMGFTYLDDSVPPDFQAVLNSLGRHQQYVNKDVGECILKRSKLKLKVERPTFCLYVPFVMLKRQSLCLCVTLLLTKRSNHYVARIIVLQ